jgi:hypothetical protein
MKFRSLCAVALLTLAVVGCNRVDNPATWSQAQLETKLKETLSSQFSVTLSELKLTKGDSGYTGTAKTGAGENYKVVVTNDAAGKKVAYKFESDRGDHIEGDYVAAQP